MTSTLMECGHASQGVNGLNKPVCVICIGIDQRASIPAEKPPDLTGRKAVCSSCDKRANSHFNLAFFSYKGSKSATDSYYCGCRGWD